MTRRRFLGIFGVLAVIIAALCAFSTNTFAAVPSVKDGQKLCGTFTYEVPGHSVSKQDFQICGIVDAQKKFKGSLELRTGNWNQSIAYVEANGNAVTIYDSPTNNNWVVGGKPGCIALPGCSGRQQFKAEVGQSFSDTLFGVRNYLSSLNNRMYWPGGSAGSYTANLKSDIDWSVEDSTADDTLAVANNKKKCEDGGGTWSGDDASGYTCSNDDTLNIAPSNSAGSTGSSTVNACYSNAGAVGWILCPVIDMATSAANGMYQIIEESFLKIDVADLFDDSNGVEQAWSAFRDIANIVFIILFIVVILSQLTGFGIDNYGIKKILPRLIIVAVLINLSYIICQLAVDVSNILGVSLREFLTGLVPQGDLGTNADGAQWTVTLAGGVLALGGVTAATLLGGLGAIFAILGAIITAVVAIFFLWIILVIRSAGIVLLIAIAPLAIACYLLPNTEKLSKRWLDIFKALLILYPLSSLVIGAGALAGRILSFSNNEVMVLAAMIVQVVPFFFIPTLLRRSLDGMGNIGARISNMGRQQGRNLSGRAQNAARNTNFAQNRQFNATRRRTQFANDHLPGSARTRARRLATLDKMEAQELAGSRLLARQDLGRAEARFDELANKDNLSRTEQNELNGIISEFANTPGYANKIVKKISSGEASAAFTQAVATHAANNSDVSAAINGKNAVMARYLADVANGSSNITANTAFSAYDTEAKRAEVAAGMSDREVASQSSESMRNLLNTDPNRISRIAQNDKIMGDIDAENAELIRDSQDMYINPNDSNQRRTIGYTPAQKASQLGLVREGWEKGDDKRYWTNKTTHQIFDARTGELVTHPPSP